MARRSFGSVCPCLRLRYPTATITSVPRGRCRVRIVLVRAGTESAACNDCIDAARGRAAVRAKARYCGSAEIRPSIVLETGAPTWLLAGGVLELG